MDDHLQSLFWYLLFDYLNNSIMVQFFFNVLCFSAAVTIFSVVFNPFFYLIISKSYRALFLPAFSTPFSSISYIYQIIYLLCQRCKEGILWIHFPCPEIQLGIHCTLSFIQHFKTKFEGFNDRQQRFNDKNIGKLMQIFIQDFSPPFW